jgi:hypothetical protein
VLPTRSCHRLMIKRRNWAVTRGGGEYGSEDSSDSDLEEEERQVRAPIVSFPVHHHHQQQHHPVPLSVAKWQQDYSSGVAGTLVRGWVLAARGTYADCGSEGGGSAQLGGGHHGDGAGRLGGGA